MGVAYMDEDGCAQGKLPKTAAKADWVRHGYNKRRRSRLYTIGDSIVKNSESHPYKRLYLERKSYEIQKFSNAGLRVLGAAEAKKQKDPYVPQIVVHLRAQRYVEKRLLKDLLGAWRRIQHQPAA